MARKIGQGSGEAWLRLGGRELREIPSFVPKSVEQPVELGMYGTVLQSELAAARMEQEPPELTMDD